MPWTPVCVWSEVLDDSLHTGNTPIRDNGEWGERGNIGSLKAMFDDYNRGKDLTWLTITIAQLLQNKGYKTGIFGKWGLGALILTVYQIKKVLIIFMVTIVKEWLHFDPPHL